MGIDFDAKDNEGRTPLSWAAGGGSWAVVKLFLEHDVGVNVNARDARGRTPLSWAASSGARYGQGLALQALLEHSEVDIDAMDNEGRTPLSWLRPGWTGRGEAWQRYC